MAKSERKEPLSREFSQIEFTLDMAGSKVHYLVENYPGFQDQLDGLAKKSLMQENFDFLRDANKLLQSGLPQKMTLEEVFNKYIKTDAPSEINLPSAAQKEIERRIIEAKSSGPMPESEIAAIIKPAMLVIHDLIKRNYNQNCRVEGRPHNTVEKFVKANPAIEGRSELRQELKEVKAISTDDAKAIKALDAVANAMLQIREDYMKEVQANPKKHSAAADRIKAITQMENELLQAIKQCKEEIQKPGNPEKNKKALAQVFNHIDKALGKAKPNIITGQGKLRDFIGRTQTLIAIEKSNLKKPALAPVITTPSRRAGM